MNKRIYYFNYRTSYTLRDKTRVRKWLLMAADKERFEVIELNYIFCNDQYLLQLNKKYLNHNSLTDILTFDNSSFDPRTPKRSLHADVFISMPRVRQNATDFNVSLRDELHRVMIHGLLHLTGYRDKTVHQQKRMRSREDYYLSLRFF